MKLSICIPVYKVEAYIEKCARSLFEQTYDDLEYIFIDDCSPDGSFAVIEKVLADYPNRRAQVKIVRHEKNAGLIRARKTGLAAATGELVTHCDSDDWIDRDFYAKMVEKFADPEVDMVFAPMVRNDDKPIVGMCDVAFSGTAKDYYALADKIVASNSTVNKIYRREVALKPGIVVPDEVKIAEDLCRTAQTVAHCRKIVSVTGTFYHYRENLESMSRKFDPNAALNDLKTVYRTIAEHAPRELIKPVLVQSARNIAFYGLKLGLFSGEEFRFWWNEMIGMDAHHWGDGLPRKRWLFLRLAGLSFALGRFLVKTIPNNKVDQF